MVQQLNPNDLASEEPSIEPTLDLEERKIDFSEIVAAGNAKTLNGFELKFSDSFSARTLGDIPATIAAKFATFNEETDMDVFIDLVSFLFVKDDREKVKEYILDSEISATVLAGILKTIIEQVTGKKVQSP